MVQELKRYQCEYCYELYEHRPHAESCEAIHKRNGEEKQ